MTTAASAAANNLIPGSNEWLNSDMIEKYGTSEVLCFVCDNTSTKEYWRTDYCGNDYYYSYGSRNNCCIQSCINSIKENFEKSSSNKTEEEKA